MAANHRHLREPLRQPGQIHWSRFGFTIAAARQPRRAANLEPGMDIHMHIQFRGEPHDRIVIGMTARYSLLVAARLFYSDAGTVADPFFRSWRSSRRDKSGRWACGRKGGLYPAPEF